MFESPGIKRQTEAVHPDAVRPPSPSSGVELLAGADEVHERVHALLSACEREVCSFRPGGAQPAAGLQARQALDAEAVERGVRLRVIFLDAVRSDPATVAYATWLAGLGGEVRTVPALPMRMLVVDRKVAVVPANAEESGILAMAITGTAVITALMALFQSTWRSATPLGTARRRDEEGLSTQERQVLKLLGEGHTDETIARRLGISGRTARRIASELLTRLGARSRFQAGARAVARGLLAEDDLA